LCSHAKLRQIVQEAPKGFGNQPQKYHYDVIYLMEPLTASEAMIIVTTKQGVDEVFVGPDVLYFSRLTARATQSHLARPQYTGSIKMYKREGCRKVTRLGKNIVLVRCTVRVDGT